MFAVFFKYLSIFLVILFGSFTLLAQEKTQLDSLSKNSVPTDSIPYKNPEKIDKIINYAKQFMGTPYRYAGMTPSGFDCSGFINYVMGNFGISLARSSYSMAEYGKTVKLADLRPGDLMFFKGSNAKSTKIGHVGLVVEVSPGLIKFIHSANGGVQITTFNKSKYYVPRFIKATRLDYGVE
ncbi:MAG: NlpC/P60 family protein [Crocinitomicaceae bacterium]|nr:MAG: NlpC/P60 family protein [Crocinitomicaceae bacterium]